MRYRRAKVIDPSTLMRLLAKNKKARLLWSISKQTNTSLFNGIVADWNFCRLSFCQWNMFYDSIYEAYNHPPDYVIWDDKKIDEWAKFQAEQIDMDHEDNYRTGMFKDRDSHKSAYAYPEIFELAEDEES